MSKNLGTAVSHKLRKELVSDKGKQGALKTKLKMSWNLIECIVEQRSPTFLAPGTGFMEDNFSMDRGGVGGGASGRNASDGERWGVADEASLARPPLLLCGPVPNRPQTGTGPRPGGWGTLL